MARPWKYNQLIAILEDEELYHTARVVAFAAQKGLFDYSLDDPDRALKEFEKKDAMKAARSSLAHFVSKRLKGKADGHVEDKRTNIMYPAWYGKRWKAGLEESLKASKNK